MAETKNRGGRPRIDATPVTVRVPPKLLAALDAFIADEPSAPTRPEAIRSLMSASLVMLKRLDPKDAT